MPLWILIALGVAVVVTVLRRARRGEGLDDLGVVSHRWLAEQRVGSWHETRR